MKENILIVEDEFIVANDLKLMLMMAGYKVCGIAASVSAAQNMIIKHQPTWVLLDIFLKDDSLGTDLAHQLTRDGIGFIYISANTNQSILETAKATQPYGFLVKPFREKDMLIMLEIALHKHQENLQLLAQRENILQKQLAQIAQHSGPVEGKLSMLPLAFQGFIPFDFLKINVSGRDGSTTVYGFIRNGFDDYVMLKNQDLHEELGISPGEISRFRIKQPAHLPTVFSNNIDYRRQLLDDTWEKQLSNQLKLNSKLFFSSVSIAQNPLAFTFYSRGEESFNASHVNLFQRIEPHLKQVFSEAPSVAIHTSQLQDIKPAVLLETDGFKGIIGKNPLLLKVLDNIDLVAPAPVSVLILGESGTGKERVAQAIHERSQRRNKPIVVVNCAALSADLIESELFGHEKGAFTGAIDKRAGKFEAADGGTIFLDEIGELPLEAQVKLLRVLQEHEFERVGSSKTIKVDVRVIAATNRNMEKEVAEGRIRLDLYYRLNVFPIELPPLRDRSDDIPLLLQHFLTKFSAKLGRNVSEVSETALEQLMSYNWPGNIRELEHLIERSVLMTRESIIESINMPLSIGKPQQTTPASTSVFDSPLKTLEQIEHDHIVDILKICGGRVNGSGGAAEILGLPPSTLNSKLKKLGIKRDFYFD